MVDAVTVVRGDDEAVYVTVTPQGKDLGDVVGLLHEGIASLVRVEASRRELG